MFMPSMDCFAEPVIGRRFAPTRWLAMTGERARLDKELARAEADIKRVDAKLANEKFVANAPEEIVEEEKEKREAAVARKEKILEALERLKNAS